MVRGRAVGTCAVLAGLAAAIFVGGLWPTPAMAQTLLLGATSTTDNSGLLDYLLPQFEAETGIAVRVVVQGSGAILTSAAAGNVDVVLVHEPRAESRFMASGNGDTRELVMTSRFLIVGPADDPAGVRGAAGPAEAFRRIAQRPAVFVSRGDESGTHIAELGLWDAAGIDPTAASGSWYRETGAGMGATLNIAAGLGAYTLTEIATWLSFGNRGRLETLFQRDTQALQNPYSVIVVSADRHPHVKIEAAHSFARWLTGPEGQAAIGAFQIGTARPFRPAAASDS